MLPRGRKKKYDKIQIEKSAKFAQMHPSMPANETHLHGELQTQNELFRIEKRNAL